MNRCYRLVWDRVRQVLVVASEISRGRGKPGRTIRARRLAWLAALPLSLSPVLGMAAAPVAISSAMPAPRMALHPPPVATPVVSTSAGPSGGQVTAGSGAISQSGLTTTIAQHSQNLSLNWQSFNIGADSTVNFVQPGAQSIAVNRIADPNGSVILGHLHANGQVFLINPNGVLFGQGAQVNVGGLVASTLNISDSELASGTRHFGSNDSGRGSVVNHGTINAAKGGYIALLGPQVTNRGTLNAHGGTVALGGGNAVTLSFDRNRLLSLQVDKSTLNALADNRQLIVADGGQVLMSAGAKDALLASVVNNSGTIQAQTVENRAGKIVLLGGMAAGTTHVAGTLDASAPAGGNGGFIETSAAHVQVADGTHITTLAAGGNTGTWLIDPADFTIAAGSGALTTSGIGADTLSSNLGGGNVKIATIAGGSENGDIHVNSPVSWSANELTLSAHGDININASLNGSGTAKLALEYGQSAMASGNTAAYHVKAPVNLVAGDNFSTKLGSNGAVVTYKVITSLGAEGSVTGTDLQGIKGNLAGRYVLGDNIDASATIGWNGGAGFAPLSSSWFTGIFDGLGHTISGLTINRPGTNNVGLFGLTKGSTISNIGLLGGSVAGGSFVGGLVGYNNAGTITRAYTTGTVSGSGEQVGGLVGNSEGPISQSYATGAVSAPLRVGGLVGLNAGSISQAYATGAVSGTGYVGGLVGNNSRSISQAYATGAVSGTNYVGGLVGTSSGGTTTSSYWATDTSGQATSAGGGSGKTLAGLIAAMPAGFDTTVWGNQRNQTTPYLLNNVGLVLVATGGTTWYTPVLTLAQLQAIGSGTASLVGSYALFGDIDASATSGWNGGAGFDPIGNSGSNFTGSFDGLGHTISGLVIKRPTTDYVGLFGYAGAGSAIRNLGLQGGSATGKNNVGGMVGYNNSGTISQAYATGTVTGTTYVGGLVGYNRPGTINQAYATGRVSSSGSFAGGLVGYNRSGTITQSYATGAVSSTTSGNVGGLVGQNQDSTITQAYATGAVSGNASVGGLVGVNFGSSTITQSYATGAVTDNGPAGGNFGGLVGFRDGGTVTQSYWNTQTTGQSHSVGSNDTFGLTSANMLKASSFAGWDLATSGGSNAAWRIYEGNAAPLLRSFMTNLAVTTNNVTTIYNGAAFVGSTDYTFGSLTPSQWLPSNNVNPSLLSGNANTTVPAINAGDYALNSGLYSGQMGYDIAFAAGTLTINQAALTITVSDVSKTYDGTTTALGVATGAVLGSDTLSGGTFTFDNKNVGAGKTVSVFGVTVNDGNNGDNYVVSYVDNTNSSITPLVATVQINASAADKVYDGSTAATITLSSSGLLAGDVVSLTGSGAFADRNVGRDKTVTVTGIVASGTHAGNYSFNTTTATTADITALGVTVDATGTNRVYDGSTIDAVSLASSGILAGDTVAFSGSGTFAGKHVGAAKAVSVSGIAASGTDAGNYSFNTTAATTADITALGVTVDATGTNRVYNGTTADAVSLASSGILAGDTVAFSGTGAFADKHVGIAKAVAVSGIAASGADAGNYSFNTTAATTADITPATLTYQANTALFWTGQVPGDLGGAVIGLLGGDTLNDATAGALAWITSATASSPAGQYAIEGSGLTARNYVFAQAPGNAMALQVANGSASRAVTTVVAGLQQDEAAQDNDAATPYAPSVRIVGGGVRLP